MLYFVYIIKCRDDTLYTGYTTDLVRRVKEHNEGKRGAKAIKGKLPVELVHSEEYTNLSVALKREAEIKSWKREKKQILINKMRG